MTRRVTGTEEAGTVSECQEGRGEVGTVRRGASGDSGRRPGRGKGGDPTWRPVRGCEVEGGLTQQILVWSRGTDCLQSLG